MAENLYGGSSVQLFADSDDWPNLGHAHEDAAGFLDYVARFNALNYRLKDDDVAQFMDDALAHRGGEPDPTPKHYEAQLRVIGRFLDEQHPRDIFFFELEGSYVIRLTHSGQGGLKQELVEFTRDDIANLIAKAPALRRGSPAKP